MSKAPAVIAKLADSSHVWTADELLMVNHEQSRKFECVEGNLVASPAPSTIRERGAFWIRRLVGDYVAASPRMGEAFGGRSDLVLDDYTVVAPDVFVVPLIGGRRSTYPLECRDVLLMVEIVTRSSQRADCMVKRSKYQRVSKEYWVVDTNARSIERWLSNSTHAELLTESLSWQPCGREAPLVVDIPALFREAHAEAP